MKLVPNSSIRAKTAEANWLFKLAESDFSLRSYNHTPQLFISMFKMLTTKSSDCAAVFDQFSMSCTKVSYCMSGGIGPVVKANT